MYYTCSNNRLPFQSSSETWVT